MVKRLLKSGAIIAFALMAMSGCQYRLLVPSSAPPATSSKPATPPVAPEKTTAPHPPADSQAAERPVPRQAIVEIGSGQFTAEPTANKTDPAPPGTGDITLNFQGTDVHEFIKAILGDALHLNYIIDPKVAGTVTLETTTPVTRDALLPLVEEVLGMNSAAMINDNGFYRIMPKANALKGLPSPTVTEHTPGGYSTRIFSLNHIAAQEMQKILEPFLPEGGTIRTDPKRNLLILGGTAQELDNLQETITLFDVDWLRGMSVGLYPLKHIDPVTLKSELDAILSGADDDLLGGLVKTEALLRLNSILLISANAEALRKTEVWIRRLDIAGETSGQRLYVYKLENAKAIELADILGQIFGTSGSPSTQTAGPSLAPGTQPREISNREYMTQDLPSARGNQLAVDPGTAAQRPIVSGDNALQLPVNNTIQIIADDIRNSLVVLATPEDYKMVEATIKQLDTVPLQVLIEASIIEVTLNDDLNYGVEWFFKNNLSDKGGIGTLDLGKVGIAALAPSFSYTIIDSADKVRVALNALAEKSSINVLSSPSLMVLDNQTAKINVGDEIPVPTRQSVSNIDPDAPTVNEIQYRKTGVTLSVKPRVNSSGLVTMEIRQEVSNAVTTDTSTLNAPTIQERAIESVVAINSGETIVLGGLIQETKSNGKSGIPFLQDIPVIGNLFSQTAKGLLRTELLVLLTPRVVKDRNEARGITDEYRKKLRGLRPVEIVPAMTDTDAPP